MSNIYSKSAVHLPIEKRDVRAEIDIDTPLEWGGARKRAKTNEE